MGNAGQRDKNSLNAGSRNSVKNCRERIQLIHGEDPKKNCKSLGRQVIEYIGVIKKMKEALDRSQLRANTELRCFFSIWIMIHLRSPNLQKNMFHVGIKT